MKNNKFLNSLLIPFLALPALAGVEVTKDGNKFVVRSCENYTDKSAVSFTIGDNGIPQFELAKNGCATKTYTEGIVKVGDIINIVGGNKKSKAVISEKASTGNDSKQGSDSAYTSDIGPIILKAELIDSTTVELQGCNPKLKMSDAISVTNRSSKKMGVSKIASVKKIKGETCFVVQFKKGEINSHDEIGVGISSVAKPVVLTVVNIPWKTQQSKPVDPKPIDTTPVDTTPVIPVDPGSGTVEVDNRKTLSSYEVTKLAEQAANRFANQVVNNLGQIENIRYNLYLGFRQAENQFGHNYKYYDEYSQGLKDGEVKGYNSGLQAGRSYGTQRGSDLARNEVVQAFENAFESGKKPSPSPRAELKMNFDGLESNTSNPVSVGERLKAKDQKIQNELRTITILEDGIILGDDVYVTYYKAYDLYSLKDYKFDYLLSFYRGERAYVAWFENMFKDSKGMQDHFNEITNPSLYKDSNENRQAFYNAFVNRYDEIINQKWNKAVTKENLKARALGTQIYLETVREYAYELGLVSTLRPAYRNASILGFNETLYPSYFSTYKSTFNTYATSAVITDISVSALKNSDLTIGDAVGVVVDSASNKGLADGTVTVTAYGTNELVSMTKNAVTYPIKALSKVKSITFSNLAFISTLTKPDSEQSLQVYVNGMSSTFYFRTTFEALVEKVGTTTNSNHLNSALGHLVMFLSKEWKNEQSFFGNSFNDNKGNLLLERFVRTYSTLPASKRQQINAYKAQIKAAYGSKPIFMTGHSDDWKSAMEIFSQIGW